MNFQKIKDRKFLERLYMKYVSFYLYSYFLVRLHSRCLSELDTHFTYSNHYSSNDSVWLEKIAASRKNFVVLKLRYFSLNDNRHCQLLGPQFYLNFKV